MLPLIPAAVAQSTEDLVRRGISEGTVDYLPDSAIQDPAKIKSILNDMLAVCVFVFSTTLLSPSNSDRHIIGQAYELLHRLVDDVEGLDKDIICHIHTHFMKTCRFSDMHYAPAGKTRTETRKSVIVSGVYMIECCPFPEVDVEVEYICKMAKVGFFCCVWICPCVYDDFLSLL
jgi:hypothetical protein